MRPCYPQVPRTQTKLTTMLGNLGMKYDGRPHCGLDDSRNIARIAMRMLQDGCVLRVNERMHAGQLMSVSSKAPETVDKADTFPNVLQKVVDWLKEKELGTKHKYAVLTDGSWDMSKFLNIQCHISRIRYPQFAKKWINIRKAYGNFYKVPRTQTKLTTMLGNLGMKYDGRPHCGLDDSRNIARIAMRMLQDGCVLRVNERMHAGQLMSVSSKAPVEGAPPPHCPHSRN
ncbi:3'-5' exoribonuclease 1 [Acipenser ruthenus]|uniref:3'-5' exoribonuclease 1 n=1 Tax=Acipenser ruthenus TaxID=7906 RepID=A0A444V2Y0_ACIRT|nr:3'-5' exoribonuclease 1 [Acipenser ruthenus]